jgi:hypothetical protein
MRNGRQWIGRAAFVAAVVCGVWLASTWLMREETHVRAGVRETTPPKAFLSGGARSEAVLIEISATLKRIEARLERLENIAQRCAGAERAAAPTDTGSRR